MKKTVHSYWRIAALILGTLAVGKTIEVWQIRSTLAGVFHYEVTVTVVDKKTKERIESVTTHSPSISSADLFRQTSGLTVGTDLLRISGIAYEPREFGFSAEEYERTNILITEDTPSTVTVELERKNEKQNKTGYTTRD